MRLNAAIFQSDYEQVQVTFFDALGGPITANAGTVEIRGFELELTALLGNKVKLDYGYTDAEYKTINTIPGLSLSIDQSAKLVNTPESSYSLGLEYSLPIHANELTFRLDYAFTDDIFNDSQNSPFLLQDSYSVWNASVRLALGESYGLTFRCRF